MTDTALAPRRRQRLADLPAHPLLALLPLVPSKGDRSVVSLRPTGDGRVIAEAGGGAAVAVVELDGDLLRPLALSRSALLTLQRRHPHAERLAVDGPHPDGPPLLRLAALDAQSSAVVQAPEADVPPGSAEALLRDVPLLRIDDTEALLDPPLVIAALSTMRRLCPGPVRMALCRHDLLGLVVRGRPSEDNPIRSATVAVARCIET